MEPRRFPCFAADGSRLCCCCCWLIWCCVSVLVSSIATQHRLLWSVLGWCCWDWDWMRMAVGGWWWFCCDAALAVSILSAAASELSRRRCAGYPSVRQLAPRVHGRMPSRGRSGAPALVVPERIHNKTLATRTPSSHHIRITINILVYSICSGHMGTFYSHHLTSHHRTHGAACAHTISGQCDVG